MRSVAIATVVVVLMVLRTAAYPVTPIETTIETTKGPITTVCPTMTCDEPNCFIQYGQYGCPEYCVCGDPACMVVDCGPDAECVENEEDSSQYTCVPRYEMTTTSPAPTSTTPCPTPACAITIGCLQVTGPDGCPSCDCQQDSCYDDSSKCGPDETCIVNGDKPYPTCVSVYETTTETTTNTCPTCDSSRCELEYDGSDGCGTCVCYTTCEGWGCDWEHETCVQGSLHNEPQCVSIYETTSPAPTSTTPCPTPACAITIGCLQVTGSDGCPSCECQQDSCYDDWSKCGPDETCIVNGDKPYPTCVSVYEPPTEPPTTCPPIECDDPNCFLENGPDGCPRQCICGDPYCMIYPCGPDEECVPSEENSSDYACVPI